MSLTAAALLRENLEALGETDRAKSNLLRALVDMAEKQDETITLLRQLHEDLRSHAGLLEKAALR